MTDSETQALLFTTGDPRVNDRALICWTGLTKSGSLSLLQGTPSEKNSLHQPWVLPARPEDTDLHITRARTGGARAAMPRQAATTWPSQDLELEDEVALGHLFRIQMLPLMLKGPFMGRRLSRHERI